MVVLLGGIALTAPFVAGPLAPFLLGLLLLGTGLLEIAWGFRIGDRGRGNSAFLGSAMSIVAGLLLLTRPNLALGAQAVLLGLSFAIDGVGRMIAAVRSRDERDWGVLFSDGLFSVLLGFFIAIQWPVTGIVSVGLTVGLRLASAGWTMLVGRTGAPQVSEAEADRRHPDARLRLEPHDEVARLRHALAAEDEARVGIDRAWRATLLVVFFATHVGRMDAEWNLIGFLSPGVAVVGDVVIALLLAWGVLIPLRIGVRRLTRPLERRAWSGILAGGAPGHASWLSKRVVRPWLTTRFRFALRLGQARRSPTTAFGWGLQRGLPLTAVLIALNPIWGFSWYFNTENWATGAWEQWAEVRVDTWREHMVRSVREEHRGKPSEAGLFQVAPVGVAGNADFSFIVIGDPGEGDASQHVLRDQYLTLGRRPDVRFLVVSSDVIYPSGDMKHYEPNFYLPFKGFDRPIYAIPGNHDWYDALEAFSANFLDPGSARTALRARREADHKLTSVTERRIEQLIAEATRLRRRYGAQVAQQRAPFFEVQADRFALLAVDTGILKSVDDEQLQWLRAALERSRGKFTMALLGHPLYAGGRYQAAGVAPFADLHRLLREHEVEVVMGGDTHYFEHYQEVYESRGRPRRMHHFVNGGGGAYLSIGTPLGWPEQPDVADCAFYPRTEAVLAKLDAETPPWKRPMWFWVRRLRAWPSTPEGVAAMFDFNRAPFYQSFVEVRVEGATGVVRIVPRGVDGPLRWRDLELHGRVLPDGRQPDDPAELTIPLRP